MMGIGDFAGSIRVDSYPAMPESLSAFKRPAHLNI
jgi:hypothetical protein